jgi:ribosome-binding ATPase YchF (GTP1/OBG family)
MKGMGLLTTKPVLYVANVPEEAPAGAGDDLGSELGFRGGGADVPPPVIPISLAIESELALLEPEERKEFLRDLGLEVEGSKRIIQAAYEALGLITFFSSNEKQTTAWAIPRGTKAPEAAGAIHSDFQHGFIRAETIGYRRFVEMGSMKAARDRGGIRSEGKDYVVADGDILLFRFNV